MLILSLSRRDEGMRPKGTSSPDVQKQNKGQCFQWHGSLLTLSFLISLRAAEKVLLSALQKGNNKT